jgi:hypothetical protein
MDFGAELFEMDDYFAESPQRYHLLLPGKRRMNSLVRKTARALQKKTSVPVTLELRRLLNEESCYATIPEMHQQDYDHVGGILGGYFELKGLTVAELELKYVKNVRPSENMLESYDLVKATFVVSGG